MNKVNPDLFAVRIQAYGVNPEYCLACADIAEQLLLTAESNTYFRVRDYIQVQMQENAERMTSRKNEDGIIYDIVKFYAAYRKLVVSGGQYAPYVGGLDLQYKEEAEHAWAALRAGDYDSSENLINYKEGYIFRYACRNGYVLTLTGISKNSGIIFYNASIDLIDQFDRELSALCDDVSDDRNCLDVRREALADFYYLMSHYHQFTRGSATHTMIFTQYLAALAGIEMSPAVEGVNINIQALMTPREVFKRNFVEREFFEPLSVDPKLFVVRNSDINQNPGYGLRCSRITESALRREFQSFDELSAHVVSCMLEHVEELLPKLELENSRKRYAVERPNANRSGNTVASGSTLLAGKYAVDELNLREDIQTESFKISPNIKRDSEGIQLTYTCRNGDKIMLTKVIMEPGYFALAAMSKGMNRIREEIAGEYSIAMDKANRPEERVDALINFYYLLSHQWKFERGSATHARIMMQYVAEKIGYEIPQTLHCVNLNTAALLAPIEVYKERFIFGSYFEKPHPDQQCSNPTDKQALQGLKVVA